MLTGSSLVAVMTRSNFVRVGPGAVPGAGRPAMVCVVWAASSGLWAGMKSMPRPVPLSAFWGLSMSRTWAATRPSVVVTRTLATALDCAAGPRAVLSRYCIEVLGRIVMSWPSVPVSILPSWP